MVWLAIGSKVGKSYLDVILNTLYSMWPDVHMRLPAGTVIQQSVDGTTTESRCPEYNTCALRTSIPVLPGWIWSTNLKQIADDNDTETNDIRHQSHC